MSERKPGNCFDLIRLLAAVSVVFAHGIRHFDAPFLGIPAGTDLFHEGVEGVRIFFVLSGMLVFHSAVRCLESKRPIRSFFANRFLRVGPAIYAYAIVATILFIALGALTMSQIGSKTYLAWFASTFALLPLYFPPEHRHIGVGVLNGSLWTIPVEVSFYLIVPALAWLYKSGRERAMWVLLSVVILAGVAAQVFLWKSHPDWFSSTANPPVWFKFFIVSLLPWLPWFALGIVWYRFWDRVPQGIFWFLGSVVLYGVLSYGVFNPAFQKLEAYHLLYALPLSYAVVWIGNHAFKGLRDISKLGDLSYGVYVWHMVIINAMLFLGWKDTWPKAALVPTALVATLITAWLSWWLIEKPALSRKPYSSR